MQTREVTEVRLNAYDGQIWSRNKLKTEQKDVKMTRGLQKARAG